MNYQFQHEMTQHLQMPTLPTYCSSAYAYADRNFSRLWDVLCDHTPLKGAWKIPQELIDAAGNDDYARAFMVLAERQGGDRPKRVARGLFVWEFAK